MHREAHRRDVLRAHAPGRLRPAVQGVRSGAAVRRRAVHDQGDERLPGTVRSGSAVPVPDRRALPDRPPVEGGGALDAVRRRPAGRHLSGHADPSRCRARRCHAGRAVRLLHPRNPECEEHRSVPLHEAEGQLDQGARQGPRQARLGVPRGRNVEDRTRALCRVQGKQWNGKEKYPGWWAIWPTAVGWRKGQRSAQCFVPYSQYAQELADRAPAAEPTPSATPPA